MLWHHIALEVRQYVQAPGNARLISVRMENSLHSYFKRVLCFLVSSELNHAREMIERAEFVYILKAAGETRDLKSDSPSAS